MNADFVLAALLYVSLVFAVLLLLISTAMVGRKMADLEFQQHEGVDGVRRIQSIINLRTHANRVLLGAAFIVITILLLADAPMIVRTWTNRVLFALVMVSYAVSSCMDWWGERQQLRIGMARRAASLDRAFAAGVLDAEGKAGAITPAPAASVDVATIQPAAVSDIVDAVREDRQP